MSKVHYFQRYSQKENVVTNNTLLLFSRLYNHSPLRFEDFLKYLLDKDDLEIGPSFTQQQSNGANTSVPDGAIVQNSFKVLIETKLGDNASLNQLTEHLKGFDNEDVQILMLVSPNLASHRFQTEMQAALNVRGESKICFCTTTFERIIEVFESVLSDHEVEMQELLEDYRDFCASENLLNHRRSVMRAVACGTSYENNKTYGIYYHDIKRGYSTHGYVGLYTRKAIRAVGKLVKVVRANYDPSTETFDDLDVVESHIGTTNSHEVTEQEKKNIVGIMHAAMEKSGDNVYRGMYFFIVEAFHSTLYEKTSKYPIQRSKFFDLAVLLEQTKLPECKQIAELLNDKVWQ